MSEHTPELWWSTIPQLCCSTCKNRRPQQNYPEVGGHWCWKGTKKGEAQ